MHWLFRVRDILLSETTDLKELAKIAGSDPAVFYRGANLARADLTGQDLRGIDFSGADLSEATIDDLTQIDDKFNVFNSSDYFARVIPINYYLWEAIQSYCQEVNYRYSGWAIKSLINNARFHTQFVNIIWVEIIEENESFKRAITPSVPSYYQRINLPLLDFLSLNRVAHGYSTMEKYYIAILIGLLIHKGRATIENRNTKLDDLYNINDIIF